MSESIHALQLLGSSNVKLKPQLQIVVLIGSDSFLKLNAFKYLAKHFKWEDDCIRTFDQDAIAWRDVGDYLQTRSLFDSDGARIAFLRTADTFVSSNRPRLESWFEKPAPDTFMVLDVSKFLATTRLYKLCGPQALLVDCNAPTIRKDTIDDATILNWAIRWGSSQHALKLTPKQAELMVDRIGAEFGLIDCELAKLALFANPDQTVDDKWVHEMVGGRRTKTVWEVADHIADGKVAKALEEIDQLIFAGESIIGIAALLSWTLRRYGNAAHYVEQQERTRGKIDVLAVARQGLQKSGFRPNELDTAQRRLVRIKRVRAKQLLGWLRDLDAKLKGSHSSESAARFALEEFVLRLA
jgi:DNA polymerase III subunit delta